MTNEQLVANIQMHDNEAENMLELWQKNKGFIYKMAMKFQGFAETEDLLQEGYIGLCEAVSHYKHGDDLFITYAAFWIKQFMQRYIYNCCSSIRVPVYAMNEVLQYKKISSEYRKLYGKEPTDWEMQGFLGVYKDKLENIKRNALTVKIRSLSEPIGGEDEEILLSDTVASDHDIEEEVVKKLDTAAMKEELWKAVDDLPGKQGEIIRKRYQDGMTLNAVGQSMGVSMERIRQEEAKGMRELRKPKTKNQKIKTYYNQYLAPAQFHHVGLLEFRRTWTSSVELEALLEN